VSLEDVTFLQELKRRTQQHADRICETAGDVDPAILTEGADLAASLSAWAAGLVQDQTGGGRPSVASSVVGAPPACATTWPSSSPTWRTAPRGRHGRRRRDLRG